MRGNRLVLVLLLLVMLAAAYVIIDRFADPATRDRLYGGAATGHDMGKPVPAVQP